jgi:hypothetical protein
MDVALGWKPRSGWAALVALGAGRDGLELVQRRRVELVADADAHWAKQPYHAAEDRDAGEACALVARGIASARERAVAEMKATLARAEAAGQRVVGCAVLMGSGMPDWSTAEILAVHFRMHKAEGELFRDAIARAAEACALRLVAIPEQQLEAHAAKALDAPAERLVRQAAELGRQAGPPWGKDQKQAALAARVALEGRERRTR